MGDNFKDCKDGNLIFYSEPRVKNKFLQKILLKLFGYKFLYKNKWITSANFTIEDIPIDKEKFNGDITIKS